MGRSTSDPIATSASRKGCSRSIAAGRVAALAVVGALASTDAAAQRVLECRFVSDADPTSALSHFSFAADISGGQLHMLLRRPPPDSPLDPIIEMFEPVRPGVTVHHEITGASGGGTEAQLALATVGPGDRVALDEWEFGDGDVFHAIVLSCPSHR